MNRSDPIIPDDLPTGRAPHDEASTSADSTRTPSPTEISAEDSAPQEIPTPSASDIEIARPSDSPMGSSPRKSADWLSDPVTLHMGTASPLLHVNQTVDEAIAVVRTSSDVGRIVYFYVIDEERRLAGVVATRKLLLSQPWTPIREIMASKTTAIPANSTVLQACEYFAEHKLLAFPIVDEERRVVGAVDVGLYTDEIQEIDRRQDADDLFQLIGIHLSEAAKVRAGPAFAGRFPWLLCNVAGGMLSALIADAYQDISTLAVVAPFIALVTALAESVSIQSVGLALQALHSQPPRWTSFLRKLQLELTVGLLLGGACGLVVGLVALLWKGSLVVAASLFLGITGGVFASAGVGLSLPFLMRLCRRDPQLASGPIALALADVVTLLCYFNLGRWLLG